MNIIELLLFCIRITGKRILKLIKSFPVLIIWAVIIAASFIYAVINKDIAIRPDIQTMVIITPFLILVSLFKSLKNYNTIQTLILYSKSNAQKDHIYIAFFIRQAFVNNIWLSAFNFIVFYFVSNKIYFAITLTATVISFLLSFSLMYLKNSLKINNTSYRETKRKKINPGKISPLIKSAVFDYVTPDFFTAAVVCIALVLVISFEITKEGNFLYELENPLIFFIGLTIILSIGFIGIIDSITNINWKFQANISPNTFNYHIKRTMLFLITIFGFLLLFFIYIGAKINIFLLFKYLYCIIMLFCISVFIAFTTGNMIIKGIILLLITAFTIWISTLSAGLLPIFAIPFLVALVKAKYEYKEWSLL
jgi:hypothetical protein